jgi:hypothetical protein
MKKKKKKKKTNHVVELKNVPNREKERDRQQWSIKRRVSHRERAKRKQRSEEDLCFFLIYKQQK